MSQTARSIARSGQSPLDLGVSAAASPDAYMPDPVRRRELGQYFTPVWAAEALVERFFPDLCVTDVVIDPSCGDGRFLQAIPQEVLAIGVEIDPAVAKLARTRTSRRVLVGDFLTIPLDVSPTVIVGNPPFRAMLIDGFLDRAHRLLPEDGRLGMVLPAHLFQTAGRVAEYAECWSIRQELIPRNLFPQLSIPLVFGLFIRSRRRTLVGFALYRETAAIQKLADWVRDLLEGEATPKSVWYEVLVRALAQLGGRATLDRIYRAIEGRRPTSNRFWKEKVRQTLQAYSDTFVNVDRGEWALGISSRL